MADKYKEPDPEVVGIIIGHISFLLKTAAEKGSALSNAELVAAVCHMYENKDFVRKEAGLAAPKAAKTGMEIEIICDKIDKLRSFAWNGDTDPRAGLNLAEAAAPFFREYGVKIKNILRGVKA